MEYSLAERAIEREHVPAAIDLAVLERQLGKQKARFTPGDRAFLAGAA
jgi:hypothetical protein